MFGIETFWDLYWQIGKINAMVASSLIIIFLLSMLIKLFWCFLDDADFTTPPYIKNLHAYIRTDKCIYKFNKYNGVIDFWCFYCLLIFFLGVAWPFVYLCFFLWGALITARAIRRLQKNVKILTRHPKECGNFLSNQHCGDQK